MQHSKPANSRVIKRVLVACRGEMAMRICRAVSDLGLMPVAVYSFYDRYALHRFRAKESYQIGAEGNSGNPYEAVDTVIKAAKACRVDAIHPGDSALAMNVAFVRRCGEEGLVFIGQSSEMLLWQEEHRLREMAQVNAIPFYDGRQRSGGNAYTIVENVFRLVDVPVLADGSGGMIVFHEQDKTIQVHGRSVLEITPAPALTFATKRELREFALKIAESMQWHQFGALRFLVDSNGKAFFCGLRFGIQKTDRITEVVAGVDIIRSQLLLGQGLLLKETELVADVASSGKGFSIFCRILAEDPENNFQPDYGVISTCNFPGGEGVHIGEEHIYPGMKITPGRVPCLADVAVTGKTFRGVVARLDAFIRECRIHGVFTNLKFLENILQHQRFLKGIYTLDFVDKHPELAKSGVEEDAVGGILKYLAEIKVNGHPDIRHWPKPEMAVPKVPEYNSFEPFPSGFKHRLREMGREGLMSYISDSSRVFFTDTTFRDAQQSLLATRVRTADLLAVAESYARNQPEVFSMEVWGGATFEVALRFLHENPWERLKELRKSMPNMLLKMALGGNTLLGYQVQPERIIYKFLDTAWEQGIDVFGLFDIFNIPGAMAPAIRHIEKHTGALAGAAIGYAGDLLLENNPYNLQFYLDNARRLEDLGAHLLEIKDLSGLMKPNEAKILISALKKHVSVPVSLHTHDVSGRQLFTCMEAIEAGVNIIDTAVSGLSGSLSQPDLNTLLVLLEDLGKETLLDLEKLNEFSDYWAVIRQLYKPFEAQALSTDAHRYRIPGSQYSNLKLQAESMRLGSRFQEVKQRYRDASDLLGGSSYAGAAQKAIGDLALYMVANGLDCYDILEDVPEKSYPLSFVELFLEKAGTPPEGFPKALQTVVLKDVSSSVLQIPEMTEVAMEKDFSRFENQYPGSCLKDYLSYKMFPGLFEDYYKNLAAHKGIALLPTRVFFYPMEVGETVTLETENAKTLSIRLAFVSRPDVAGMRSVFFEQNGYGQVIKIKDGSLFPPAEEHPKASSEGSEIGSPLPGRLIALLVREGEKVVAGTPLFIVETMKMEVTVKAPFSGVVCRIALPLWTELEQNDLIICLS